MRPSAPALRSLVLVGTMLGAACGSEPTAPPPAAAQARPQPSIAQRVGSWLDRAGTSPHNGSNPQLELPPALLTEGAGALQQAITSGPELRRRDAASALARHPEPGSQRTFWRSQLTSDDPTVRFYALTTLASIHDPADFEPWVRAAHEGSDANTLAVRVRDWHDRRAVPILVDLLSSGSLAADNAAGSLTQSPDVPVLPAEQVDPAATAEHLEGGPWRAPATTLVQPYQRWWTERGRSAFAAECTWWLAIAPDSPACAPLPAPAGDASRELLERSLRRRAR